MLTVIQAALIVAAAANIAAVIAMLFAQRAVRRASSDLDSIRASRAADISSRASDRASRAADASSRASDRAAAASDRAAREAVSAMKAASDSAFLALTHAIVARSLGESGADPCLPSATSSSTCTTPFSFNDSSVALSNPASGDDEDKQILH